MIATKSSLEYAEKASRAAFKAAATKRQTVVDGETLLQRTAKKIRESNLRTDELGRTGYEKAAQKAAQKVRASNEARGNWKSPCEKSEFDRYRAEVAAVQRRFKKQIVLLENYSKRAPSGTTDGFHIDHRVSVWFGFVNGISPEIIGHICNLQMKHWLDNNRKWSKCDITLGELLESIRKYES